MNIVVAIETDMSDVLGFHQTCLCTAVSLRGGAVVKGRLRFVPRAPLHLGGLVHIFRTVALLRAPDAGSVFFF